MVYIEDDLLVRLERSLMLYIFLFFENSNQVRCPVFWCDMPILMDIINLMLNMWQNVLLGYPAAQKV